MTLLEVAFWTASLLVIYPYVLYPLLLRFAAGGSRGAGTADPAGPLPAVTFIVSAYNEEDVLERKLANALAIDYPAGSLEVMVVSDASDDSTDEIVRRHGEADPRIRLVRQSERRGKSAGLNLAVAEARGEVLVFSDANAMYEPDSLRRLVEHFRDAEVGYVVGAAHYHDSDESEVKRSEGLYWRFELWLKELESRFHSVVGGDGAIYATRRELFWNLEDDDISDFVNPLQIVAAGYRGVFDPDARCREDSADSFAKEFRRKRRIVNRSWRAVKRYGGRLSLARHGRYLFMLVSHKVIRWHAMAFITLATLANVGLLALGGGALYAATLTGIGATFVLALIGHVLERPGTTTPRIFYIAYYFYLVNIAGILGIWDELRGIRHATWEHARQT